MQLSKVFYFTLKSSQERYIKLHYHNGNFTKMYWKPENLSELSAKLPEFYDPKETSEKLVVFKNKRGEPARWLIGSIAVKPTPRVPSLEPPW